MEFLKEVVARAFQRLTAVRAMDAVGKVPSTQPIGQAQLKKAAGVIARSTPRLNEAGQMLQGNARRQKRREGCASTDNQEFRVV
jgi:hypothetical protein